MRISEGKGASPAGDESGSPNLGICDGTHFITIYEDLSPCVVPSSYV